MAYDEGLAERLREVLRDTPEVAEKRMFGGLAFMIHGNMGCGVIGEELMVRTGPAAYEAALARPHARAMDFTRRPMRGFVFVGCDGFESDDDLEFWVRLGTGYALSLPPK